MMLSAIAMPCERYSRRVRAYAADRRSIERCWPRRTRTSCSIAARHGHYHRSIASKVEGVAHGVSGGPFHRARQFGG
jgi:hypothetical protein